MARPLQQIDLAAILAERRFGVLHLTVLATCALALLAAGFNAALMAPAAAAIARALDLPTRELAQSSSWSGLGVLVGMLLGSLGDWTGRRRVIILSLLVFGAASLATAAATEATAFKALELVTGLGIGALLPNALALMFELMPRRNRFALTALAWIGYAVGSALAGPIAASLLQRYVWPALFLLGGVLPIIMALLLWGLLPESPLLLVGRGAGGTAQISATLSRISRRYDSFARQVAFVSGEPVEPGLALLRLFRHGRAVPTILLWATFLAAAFAAFLFDADVPAVLAKAQLGESNAALAQELVRDVGVLGGFIVASLADRIERFAALAAGLVAGAVVLGLLAVAGGGNLALLLAFGAGFFLGGAVIGLGVFAASCYPSALRATGTGFALAAGGIGQAAISILAPALVARNVSLGLFLAASAVAALLAAAAAGALALARR